MQNPTLELNRTTCFFASDLHGDEVRYGKLFHAILDDPPGAVFLGGDLCWEQGVGAILRAGPRPVAKNGINAK